MELSDTLATEMIWENFYGFVSTNPVFIDFGNLNITTIHDRQYFRKS